MESNRQIETLIQTDVQNIPERIERSDDIAMVSWEMAEQQIAAADLQRFGIELVSLSSQIGSDVWPEPALVSGIDAVGEELLESPEGMPHKDPAIWLELKDKRIAVLATDGFEQSELTEPVKALRQAGATVDIISLNSGEIQGMQHHDKGDMIQVDHTLDEVSADDYAGLVLPGGVANPDTLRIDARAVDFVRQFDIALKPIAAICHGPWTLIEAEAIHGRKMTSWPSLKTDLENAGAEWVDEEVIVDQGLITSRNPSDLPAFCRKMIEEFQGGWHVSGAAS